MNPPFLTKKAIEEFASSLYGRALEEEITETIPVNVENIVEFGLGYRLNLAATLPPTVLGSSDWETKLLQVSEAVTHNGRRRFTIAHEIGHIVLHFPLLQARGAQQPLFLTEQVPLQDKRTEWQADRFAGALLMPHELMLDLYSNRARTGELIDPREVATTFDVSRQSAQIRLEALKLVLTDSPGTPLDFDDSDLWSLC